MRAKLLSLLLLVSSVAAQSVDPTFYQDLRYRNIGPFRAGRTVGAVVPQGGKPNEFCTGVNNGGVWKTDDYGCTQQPIIDSIDTALQSPATQRNAKKRETLQSLRGSGAPGNPDLLYSSITAVAPDKETIVGLQHKFLYMLSVLKNAETRPTQQALAGVKMLEETAAAVVKRWEVLK